MKVQRVDSGVFRFEPDERDAPVWDLSPEQVLHHGWSEKLVDLVGRYLRPSTDRKIREVSEFSDASHTVPLEVSSKK